jgi:hypothetical protein
VPERTIAPQPCPHALENNQRIHHAGYGPVYDARVRPLRIAELTRLVDFVAPKAKVCGGWLSVAVSNARKIIPDTGHLAPVLRRVVFLGQSHLGAGLNGKGICLRPMEEPSRPGRQISPVCR